MPEVNLDSRPFDRRDASIVAIASMEQIIGAALSAVVGIMLPMLQLAQHVSLPSLLQGVVGAMGLIGIGIGSPIIGRLSDRYGYLLWFRLCPVIILAGALFIWLVPHVWAMIPGLFIIGFGVGGGYSLDSAYISELMPARWKQFMVGVAKAGSALGFVGAAVMAWLILRIFPTPEVWNAMILIIAALGLLTLLLRIRWAGSPVWLMEHGKPDMARRAALRFFNTPVELPLPQKAPSPGASPSWGQMFRGKGNLLKVIFCGVPWACEGLAVYGFGVFLPVLVMALGIESQSASGLPKILQSVEITAIVNFFMLPGFVLGLLMLARLNHIKMLSWGFLFSAAGLALLFVAYRMHMPLWVMISGFVIFEVSLNAGPHLLTFILPSAVYSVEERGAGAGIAAMNGKVGAIVGVVLMPVLLESGGMTLVLGVSIAVMLLGAAVAAIVGPKVADKP